MHSSRSYLSVCKDYARDFSNASDMAVTRAICVVCCTITKVIVYIYQTSGIFLCITWILPDVAYISNRRMFLSICLVPLTLVLARRVRLRQCGK